MKLRKLENNNQIYKILSQRILYCDRDVIVFNKPYGLAVQDGSKVSYSVDSIISSLDSDLGNNARLVHRIDKKYIRCLDRCKKFTIININSKKIL